MNKTSTDAQLPIAVTMGDPSGVGPELCLDLLQHAPSRELAAPIIYGEKAVLEAAAQATGKALPNPDAIRELSGLPADWKPGNISAETGAASYRYIQAAIDDAKAGNVRAVVTCPISKEALDLAGVPYLGHTEIFADQTDTTRYCMMLSCDSMSCSLVTLHVGLKDVPSLLTADKIFEVIELTHQAMLRLRGRKPRLTVLGLNPHAGEHGLFGDREEERLIQPAVDRARALGIDLSDPIPPDTAFILTRQRETDAYVCMYHDQGLIPLKMLAFDEAVNLTLGLPIVRTSVDHGTALDIAWKGIASPNSLFAAYRLAHQLATGEAGKT